MVKKVSELMSKGFLTVTPSMRVSELAAFLEEGRLHGVPVVDKKGKLLGVVSRTDVVRLLAQEQREEGFHNPFFTGFVDDEDYRALWPARAKIQEIPQTVRDIMSSRVVSIPETASAGTAAAKMAKEKIHRILVTREGAFVGILSASDLLSCLAEYERAAFTQKV